MADTFSCIFSSVLDVHAPLKRRRISKKSTPWITPKVKQLMRERDQLKTRATIDSTLWPRYKALRNKVTYELRNCVQQYYHAIIEENSNDPKEMWRAINKVLNKDSPSSFSAVNFQGQRLDRPNKVAEAFNEHFVTIGPKLASNIEQKPDDNPLKYLEENNENSPKFQFKQVEASYVRKAVIGLKNSKSPGPDNIPTKLLKDAIEYICQPLAMIFNASLETGIFPDIWKLARVTPIYKSGQTSNLSNYRPISVLSVLSRLLEKLVHDQLYDFCKTNDSLSKNQFAFRKLHSTITSMLNITETWYKNIDERKLNVSVFLDLKKAFDTVDHDILLSKLSALGVIETTHCWFTSYLRNREQFCRVDGQNSSTKSVNCGIPQGSCLGPLLFIIYVNDFERCLQGASPNMYADDTSITCSSADSDSLLRNINDEMTNIAEWMRLNKLSLNADKSEFMVIGHSRQHNVLNELREIEVDHKKINRVTNTKYLGLNIDENLSWKDQYKTVKTKVKSGLSAIRKLKDILPQSKLAAVYRALIESHLRYGNILWGCISDTKLSALQRLQSRANFLIENAKYKDGWVCDWLPVKELIRYDRLVMTHKILHGNCPDNLQNKFMRRSQISSYSTRNSQNLHLPKPRLEFTKKSFQFTGASIWNEIPQQYRDLPALNCFKKEVKQLLRS